VKGDAISIVKDSSQHKYNPNHWSWNTKYNTFPKTKKSSGYEEMSKILKACASLISHPLNYVYNH
jgi:hypothetical protein